MAVSLLEPLGKKKKKAERLDDTHITFMVWEWG